MSLYALDTHTVSPLTQRTAPSAWVADSAQVMGNVEVANDVSIWFGAVIRGESAGLDAWLAATPDANPVAGDELTSS